MKWIVTSLDVLVILLFLWGTIVWRNALPEYLASTYVKSYEQNGTDVEFFAYRTGSLWYRLIWQGWRGEGPAYDYMLLAKGKSDFLYHRYDNNFLVELKKNVSDYSSSELRATLESAYPPIWIYSPHGKYSFISTKIPSKWYMHRVAGYKTVLYTMPYVGEYPPQRLAIWADSTDESVDRPLDTLSEDFLLTWSARSHFGTFKTHCSLEVQNVRLCVSGPPEKYQECIREWNQSTKKLFEDTSYIRALHDVFRQLNLKPNCLDSLTEVIKD
ncbi:MAG: hypothetical protein HUK20_14115 [Fibrobacter sp.]|nr:hypothetical protein [Fibrobacter sp.]